MAQDLKVSGAEIDRWQERRDTLRNQMKAANDELMDIERRLAAAAILATAVQEQTATVPNGMSVPAGRAIPPAGEEESEAASDRLYNSLVATGESLKVAQIRERLIKLGVEQAKTRPNYTYGLVYRMVQGGRLLKRGSKYRAGPKPSPQGETGAVAAPASSVTH